MAKITLSLLFILTCTLCSFTQEATNDEEIFTVVEQKPQFPAGEKERIRFVLMHTDYPSEARMAGIYGTVYVTFIIEKTGRVSHAKVTKGIGGGCDEEAVRLVESMPNWIPGKQGGKPVRVQYTMPVEFYKTNMVSDTTYNPDDDIFTNVDDNPDFPGGYNLLYIFLHNNTIYPEEARKSGIEGYVTVAFVIEKSGRINHVKISNGLGGGCNEEAIRVVKLMPKWKAGKLRGRPVRVQRYLPIKFSSDGSNW